VKNLGGKKFFSPEHFDFGRKENFFTGVVGVWWVCGGCVVGSLEENKNELAH
jgi:hypothetical protein